MFCNFIMPVPWVHLACLRTHLVILGPVLLRSYTVEMTNAVLIAGAIQVHALVYVVVDVERVYRKSSSSDHIYQCRKVLFKTGFYVYRIRACCVVSEIYAEVIELAIAESSSNGKVGVSKSGSCQRLINSGTFNAYRSPRYISTEDKTKTWLHWTLISPVSSFPRNFFRS